MGSQAGNTHAAAGSRAARPNGQGRRREHATEGDHALPALHGSAALLPRKLAAGSPIGPASTACDVQAPLPGSEQRRGQQHLSRDSRAGHISTYKRSEIESIYMLRGACGSVDHADWWLKYAPGGEEWPIAGAQSCVMRSSNSVSFIQMSCCLRPCVWYDASTLVRARWAD